MAWDLEGIGPRKQRRLSRRRRYGYTADRQTQAKRFRERWAGKKHRLNRTAYQRPRSGEREADDEV